MTPSHTAVLDAPAAGAPNDTADVTRRVERLNTASLRRVLEPDEVVTGAFGDGQVLPDELLSVDGLGLELTAEQKATLAREEVASIATNGLQFEAVLMAGFALRIAEAPDMTDPRVVYMLHEVGEETRHSRLFVRMLGQLGATARDPFAGRLGRLAFRVGSGQIIRRPALLYTLVLGGEEIPDLFQKLAAEHPDTDPFLREVNRYHRSEEARHLAYARLVLPEVLARAGALDRFLVRRVAPFIIGGMFETIVHPGVYATIGLPSWRTWRAANRTPRRVGLRRQATRPIVAALLEAGAFRHRRVTRPWRVLAGVDTAGRPVAGVHASEGATTGS